MYKDLFKSMISNFYYLTVFKEFHFAEKDELVVPYSLRACTTPNDLETTG
jgi:hypothetical protein